MPFGLFCRDLFPGPRHDFEYVIDIHDVEQHIDWIKPSKMDQLCILLGSITQQLFLKN